MQFRKESLKKFRLVRDLNPWPLRYRYSALPIKLTSQPGAGRWIGSWKALERMMMKLWIYENHICALRSEELFEGRSSQLGRQLMQLRKKSPVRSMGSWPCLYDLLPIGLFLAKRRAARFTISSRAKRACITQASQRQRDFLLAKNLSILSRHHCPRDPMR